MKRNFSKIKANSRYTAVSGMQTEPIQYFINIYDEQEGNLIKEQSVANIIVDFDIIGNYLFVASNSLVLVNLLTDEQLCLCNSILPINKMEVQLFGNAFYFYLFYLDTVQFLKWNMATFERASNTKQLYTLSSNETNLVFREYCFNLAKLISIYNVGQKSYLFIDDETNPRIPMPAVEYVVMERQSHEQQLKLIQYTQQHGENRNGPLEYVAGFQANQINYFVIGCDSSLGMLQLQLMDADVAVNYYSFCPVRLADGNPILKLLEVNSELILLLSETCIYKWDFQKVEELYEAPTREVILEDISMIGKEILLLTTDQYEKMSIE